MASEEQTVEVHFDMKRPGEVSFVLPVRVPNADWATASLNTLRQVHGINQIKCQPDTYKLDVVMARNKGVAELLTEIVQTIVELMGLESVHQIAIKAERAQTSMLSAELLVEALRQLAIREWTSIHTLSLGMARDERTELEQRIRILRETEKVYAGDEADAEKDLRETRATLADTRQSFNDSRHADTNVDVLIALGVVIQNLGSNVTDLEKTLETHQANLVTTREELAVLESLLTDAQMKVGEIEKLTCPRYKATPSRRGKDAVFSLKARLTGGKASEGDLVEMDDAEGDATDQVSDVMS